MALRPLIACTPNASTMVTTAGSPSGMAATASEMDSMLTETQAAQADTDALAVDQEYRVAMLELGMTDDTTTDTTT